MNLDELQSVQSRERQTDSLQQLRATFYQDAAEFVQELRTERTKAAERADDPFDSPDVNRLSDDIRTAEQTVEAIYERRVGKVVKMASLAAADMPTEQEGLTAEEQELFETMVTAIENHRESILTVLGGEAPTGAVSSPPPDDLTAAEAAAAAESDDGLDAAAMMGEGDDEDPTAIDASQPSDESGDAPADSTDEPTDVDDGPTDVNDGPPAAGGELTDAIGGPGAGSDTDEPRDGPTADGPGGDGSSGAGDQSPRDEATDGDGKSDDDSVSDGDGLNNDNDADETSDTPSDVAVDTDRVTVRITEDVGEIFGVDEREYDLATDDVVTLPTTNAEPLIDRDAAEPIE